MQNNLNENEGEGDEIRNLKERLAEIWNKLAKNMPRNWSRSKNAIK